MAQNGRFNLSLRVLAVLAEEPEANLTSGAIGEMLDESPVMVRRVFPLLHEAGFIVQRKGPQGGARLKMPAKQIGLGDLYAAMVPEFLVSGDKGVDAAVKKVRGEAIEAMNETSLASVAKKLKKS